MQKFCWLTNLFHDVGFYNQAQLDILWSYLIVCLDFFNKQNDENLIKKMKHKLIVISILKTFSRFNYLNTQLYKTQNKIFLTLFEAYFEKYKLEFSFNDLIYIVRALISLNIFSNSIFKYFYDLISIYTKSQNENEIYVDGQELEKVRKFLS